MPIFRLIGLYSVWRARTPELVGSSLGFTFSRSTFEAMKLKKLVIGLVYHLVPPRSNQQRCPPRDVVSRTVFGFCLNSSNGIASRTDMGSSVAEMAKNGMRIEQTASEDEASR